jgi:hypothetical protein
VAGRRDPEIPKHPFLGVWEKFFELSLSDDDRLQHALRHAQRTGDLSKAVALARQTGQPGLANGLQKLKLKRPSGNPNPQGDPWVWVASEVASYHKLMLYISGWKKSRGGDKIDDIVIGRALEYMREHGYPMRPDEDKFEDKVRTKLHQSHRPRKGDDGFAGTKVGEDAITFARSMLEHGYRPEMFRSRPPRKRK